MYYEYNESVKKEEKKKAEKARRAEEKYMKARADREVSLWECMANDMRNVTGAKNHLTRLICDL